jgi:hypothetical protein
MILFHGGCHDCTQQDKHGPDFCFDCCYFNADWNKPSLNNKPPSEADIMRLSVVASRRSRAEVQSTAATKRENVATVTASRRHEFRPGELVLVSAPDNRWWRRAWFRLLRRGEPKLVFQGRITQTTDEP